MKVDAKKVKTEISNLVAKKKKRDSGKDLNIDFVSVE